MSKMRVAIIAVALFSSSAHAQSVPVYGPGGVSCATYSSARAVQNASFDAALGFWFSGFLTGHNLYSIQPVYETKGKLNFPAMFASIDRFCKINPKASVMAGMAELVDQNIAHR